MLYYPYIDPVAISIPFPFIEKLQIRWYGLTYLIGFVATWWLGHKRLKQFNQPMNANQFDDFLFYGILGVIIGGRLGYTLFYQFSEFINNPLYIFYIWKGGMSFHGGLLGVLLVTGLFSYYHKIPLFAITDFLAPLTPIGLGMGRIGNFINGELWGVPTELPWGMRIPIFCKHFPEQCNGFTSGFFWSEPLHPSQLYEAILEGLVLFILLWWFSKRQRPTMAVSGLFLIVYATIRCVIELVRQPDAHLGYLAYGWVTMGQILSLPMLIGGIILLALAYWQRLYRMR